MLLLAIQLQVVVNHENGRKLQHGTVPYLTVKTSADTVASSRLRLTNLTLDKYRQCEANVCQYDPRHRNISTHRTYS